MRYIVFAISILFFKANGQDCITLNSFNTFHGLKLGENFPDSLKKYFNINVNTTNKSYVEYEMPDKMPLNKYTTIKHYLYENSSVTEKFGKWFYFGSNMFSNIYISCLLDGRIFEFSLLMDLRDGAINNSYYEDSIAITNNKIPPGYITISDEIASLFGQITKQDDKWVMNVFYEFSRYWECEKNAIDLTLTYSPSQYGSHLGLSLIVTIKSKDLEKIQKLKVLSN